MLFANPEDEVSCVEAHAFIDTVSYRFSFFLDEASKFSFLGLRRASSIFFSISVYIKRTTQSKRYSLQKFTVLSVINSLVYQAVYIFRIHGRIQKLTSWGWGLGNNVLLYISLVIVVFHLPREEIGPKGSNCFSRGIRTRNSKETNIATCDFAGGRGSKSLPPSPPPMDPSMELAMAYT